MLKRKFERKIKEISRATNPVKWWNVNYETIWSKFTLKKTKKTKTNDCSSFCEYCDVEITGINTDSTLLENDDVDYETLQCENLHLYKELRILKCCDCRNQCRFNIFRKLVLFHLSLCGRN